MVFKLMEAAFALGYCEAFSELVVVVHAQRSGGSTSPGVAQKTGQDMELQFEHPCTSHLSYICCLSMPSSPSCESGAKNEEGRNLRELLKALMEEVLRLSRMHVMA